MELEPKEGEEDLEVFSTDPSQRGLSFPHQYRLETAEL